MIGFIWTRQSNRYDKAVYSLESQLDACRDAARADGVPVTPDREYVVKFSGVDLWAIPELADLRAAIERTPGPKRVYCYAQDRMARGEEGPEIFWIVYELRRYGAELKIILDPIDLSDFSGQVNMLFKGHKAAREPKDIAERTLRGKLKRVREGKLWNHGLEKFGYRRIKEEGRAVFDEEEKAVLEEMIERVFAGQSVRSIAQYLNDRSIPTPDRRRGRPYKGEPTKGIWRHNAITAMLRDPALKGEGAAMRYRDGGGTRRESPREAWITIPNAYPALLSPERWDDLQVKLSETVAKNLRARNGGIPFVFRGRVICEACGRPMIVISKPYHLSGGEKRQSRAYACKHVDDGMPRCESRSQINTRYVEDAGWAAVVEAFRPEALEAAAARAGSAPEDSSHVSRRKTLEQSLIKKRTQQQTLITRLADASDVAAPAILKTIDEIGQEVQNIQDQIRRVNLEIQTSGRQARRTQDAMRDLAQFARRFDKMEFQEKRKFVELMGIVLRWNPRERTLTLDSQLFS